MYKMNVAPNPALVYNPQPIVAPLYAAPQQYVTAPQPSVQYTFPQQYTMQPTMFQQQYSADTKSNSTSKKTRQPMDKDAKKRSKGMSMPIKIVLFIVIVLVVLGFMSFMIWYTLVGSNLSVPDLDLQECSLENPDKEPPPEG
jgi:hypothetical protein